MKRVFAFFLMASSLLIGSTAFAQRPFDANSRFPIASTSSWPLPTCTAPGPFTDVPDTHPFCPFILQLVNDGITVGCGGGNYCPESSITRKQMAVFLERAMRGTTTWSPWQGVYRRTIVVNPVVGGTYYDNGTALLAAMAQATAGASLLTPYLVVIEPGFYHLNTSVLTIPAYVVVVGAGRESTYIYGSGAQTVVMGDPTELREVSVTNDSLSASSAVSGVVTVRNASIFKSEGASPSYAVDGTEVTLENVTLNASGGNVDYVVVRATGAQLSNLDLSGGSDGAITGISVNGQTLRIYNSFISIYGNGAIDARAVRWQNGTTGQIRGTTVYLSCAASCKGLDLEDIQDAQVQSSRVEVFTTGASGIAVANKEAKLTIMGSTLKTLGGFSTALSTTSATPGQPANSYVIGSQLIAANQTMEAVASGGGTAKNNVGATEMNGGAAAATGGTNVCANDFDENYTSYASTCP
jgi:hypothetical protein